MWVLEHSLRSVSILSSSHCHQLKTHVFVLLKSYSQPHLNRSYPLRCRTRPTWKMWWVWKQANVAQRPSHWLSRSWRLQNPVLHHMILLPSWRAACLLRLASLRATDRLSHRSGQHPVFAVYWAWPYQKVLFQGLFWRKKNIELNWY